MVTYSTWVEIDLSAIAHNMQQIVKLVNPGVKIMAVVKANGYGHGALPVAKTVLTNGATSLAVARLEEGMALRRQGINCPILVLGYVPMDQYSEVIAHNLILTVYTQQMAEALNFTAAKLGKKVKVHIKIDTGMGRLGFLPSEQEMNQVSNITKLRWLEVEGIYTHFAKADSADKTYTRQQFNKFMSFLHELAQRNIDFKLRHVANSAAIIDYPETHLDMVRAGLMLYGLYPSDNQDREQISLWPAMTFKSRVAHVKKVTAGTSISYGCCYAVPEESIIATLPLGYADGYTRMLSDAEVLVRGKRVPVVGRICMDQCMVNLGHSADVQVGDEVVIFGAQGKEYIPVEELAQKLNTISYEILCMVADRVPRVYITRK